MKPKLLKNDQKCKHFSFILFTIWSHRLTVRTPGFHPGNRSSILREITIENASFSDGAFSMVGIINSMQTNGEKLRGVNLGGWLVLEKWMTPSLFAGTNAIDEYTFVRTAGAAQKITHHRDTFITEGDFAWLKANGINAVRVPIGFWGIEQREPLLSTMPYIDWTMEMAAKYDLKVLLCMHGAFGSQNGQDHSGRVGSIRGYRFKHRSATRTSLKRLAMRYGQHENLWGIELLNEPLGLNWWRSWVLRQWSRRTMHRLARILPKSCKLVYSDAFQPDNWTALIHNPRAVLDVHHYQCFSPTDKQLSVASHIAKIQAMATQITRWQNDQPVIIGEWSLGLDEQSLQGASRQAAQKLFLDVQLNVYSHADGWFFWSYKMEDVAGWNSDWNFRHLVESGYFDALTDGKVLQ
jgi:glucan 1,3-beta-glucosidase